MSIRFPVPGTTALRHTAAVAFLLAASRSTSSAQPGFPPNDPDSWRVAGTAKVLCSALFVSGRDSAEARAHVRPTSSGTSSTRSRSSTSTAARKLVRLTLADRITREAKLYGDQGCVIHQPGRDSVYFTPVAGDHARCPTPPRRRGRWATSCPTTPLPAGDRHRQAPAGRGRGVREPGRPHRRRSSWCTAAGSWPSATRTARTRTCSSRAGRWARASPAR